MEDLKVKLIHELYEIGAIKFEEITLKTGVKSPIYFDLRLTMRYPQLVVSDQRIFLLTVIFN